MHDDEYPDGGPVAAQLAATVAGPGSLESFQQSQHVQQQEKWLRTSRVD